MALHCSDPYSPSGQVGRCWRGKQHTLGMPVAHSKPVRLCPFRTNPRKRKCFACTAWIDNVLENNT